MPKQPNAPPAPRVTSAAAETRKNQVYKMLLRGARRVDIIEFADNKKWDIATSTIDMYIARATAEIKSHSQVDRDYQLAEARERLRELYTQAQSVKDLKTALMVQKEINTLESLYLPPAPKTLNLNTRDISLIDDLTRLLQNSGVPLEQALTALINELAHGKPDED